MTVDDILTPKVFVIPFIQSNITATNMVSGMIAISGSALCIYLNGRWNYISGSIAKQPITV